jgi:hypothetical protein
MPFPADGPKKVSDKMDAGILPREAPGDMYAGFGTGKPCVACDLPILPGQVEYEFEAADRRTVRFHLGCAGSGKRSDVGAACSSTRSPL